MSINITLELPRQNMLIRRMDGTSKGDREKISQYRVTQIKMLDFIWHCLSKYMFVYLCQLFDCKWFLEKHSFAIKHSYQEQPCTYTSRFCKYMSRRLILLYSLQFYPYCQENHKVCILELKSLSPLLTAYVGFLRGEIQ